MFYTEIATEIWALKIITIDFKRQIKLITRAIVQKCTPLNSRSPPFNRNEEKLNILIPAKPSIINEPLHLICVKFHFLKPLFTLSQQIKMYKPKWRINIKIKFLYFYNNTVPSFEIYFMLNGIEKYTQQIEGFKFDRL